MANINFCCLIFQTSKKRAIETTDITRSFGWDSSEGLYRRERGLHCEILVHNLKQGKEAGCQGDSNGLSVVTQGDS